MLDPSKEIAVARTSPVISNVLAVSRAVAVVALPSKLEAVTTPVALIPLSEI